MGLLYNPTEFHVKRPHAKPAKHFQERDLQKHDFSHMFNQRTIPSFSVKLFSLTKDIKCIDKGIHLTTSLNQILGVTKAMASPLPLTSEK
jgi:hypothetical protein